MTLRVLNARSNVPLIGQDTILSPFIQPMRTWLTGMLGGEARRQANNLVEIAVFGIIVVILVLLVLTGLCTLNLD